MRMIKIYDEWDDPKIKESHPGKPLQVHINEIERILSEFLKFYSFPTNFNKILKYIAEYHDYGKLNKKWNVYNESNPDHSPLSVKYLLNHKILSEDKEITFILWYLIAKHHSSLTKSIKDPDLNKFLPEIEAGIKKLDFIYKINLIDLFGIFKIADVCSAQNRNIKLEKPSVSEEIVKKIILCSTKSGIDKDRWSEQQKLSYLPDIGLVRAYTGWGKTDVSLLFFQNKNVNKIFYLFPTITAINKFYQKLSNVFGDGVTKYFYFYDTEVKEDLELLQNMFFVENFLSPIVVTTIDQFLLSFLQVGKYYKKRVMFRNSGIVIDEVHLLSPLMLKLLTYFIKKFQNIYNFKVLFMSATLPESLKKYLEVELNLPPNSFLDFSDGYKERRRILFEYYNEDIEAHIDEIIKEFKSGNKVIVVVNTVEKSVNIAEKLREELGEKNVLLLHARFMYFDRKEKEYKIDKLRNVPHILITTQVCEVSLDISYDFMFTELAPLSSLIQRFGRVNRYGIKTDKINVKIFKPSVKNEKHYPYTQDELSLAEKVIKELSGEKLEDEFKLLKIFDELHGYEDLLKVLEKEGKKVNLEQFEKILQFFFSLDISEKELVELLSYRDSFTTLVIPSFECIESEKARKLVKEVINLLERGFKNKNYAEIRQLVAKLKKAKLKEVSVPVPIWWVRQRLIDSEKIFPIIDFNDKVYNSFSGLRELKSEII
jgi:CRISPR-associated endonuclease/helicase Cas3